MLRDMGTVGVMQQIGVEVLLGPWTCSHGNQ
jgi:hypothetical protein